MNAQPETPAAAPEERIGSYRVHPVASLFPLMTGEELEELARDITANGLLHPLVVDAEGQLIDGRNRLAACEIAKVEPRFEQLNGRDPLAYIVSANLNRRNLTKGQQAMALAMIYPEPEKGGRGKKSEALNSAVSAGFSTRRLNAARSVLHHSRELAESVIKGSVSLDAALEKVAELQQQAISTDAKIARLQEAAPDLAARVADEGISLYEAIAILQQREESVRRVREAGRIAAERILSFAGLVSEIHMAIEAGEDICIPASHIKTLRDALRLLTNHSEPANTA
jgi:ParB-like nuclease domain